MSNNTRWTLLFFHEFYENFQWIVPLIFLFKFFHPHKGEGAYPFMVLRLNTLLQPHIEREREAFLWLLPQNINELYLQFPQPLCRPSCLKYWSFQGSKFLNSCLNLLTVKVWIKFEWRLKFSIENAFLGEHDQILFFKNIFFKNWIFGMLEKVTIPNISAAKNFGENTRWNLFRRNFSPPEIFPPKFFVFNVPHEWPCLRKCHRRKIHGRYRRW